MTKTLALSINGCWNFLNFRMGLIRRLQDAGYRIVAIAPEDESAVRLREHGIDLLPIAIDPKGMSPFADLMLLRRYHAILRELRPDAYLGWTIKPNIYGSIAASMLHIPTINNVSGLGTAFIRQSAVTTLVSWLYRTAFRRAATIFFQNRHDRDLFVAKRLVASARTALLPGSGIDTERFRPVEVSGGDADDDFRFLLIARLLRDKGVFEFVEAARSVRADHPQARFQLLGAIDAQNRTAIGERQVRAWTDEGIVEHLGAHADVRPYIAAADCVVLPSYREGMPRTLLEAAAMAKPLIATDVPGCTEIARDGVNAELCAVRDADSLRDAMMRMMAFGAERRAAYGLAGRAIAVAEFSEEIVADKYLRALDAALE